MVEDHLFSTGDPSRRVPCSTDGKLIYLGLSMPFSVLEDAIFLFFDLGLASFKREGGSEKTEDHKGRLRDTRRGRGARSR
jgi:hypothetical protein